MRQRALFSPNPRNFSLNIKDQSCFPTRLNSCCLQQMLWNAEVSAAGDTGLILMHPPSCLAWVTDACLWGFALTRSCSFYWSVGLNRLWEVILSIPLQKAAAASVFPASCITCAQSIRVVEALHPSNWATIPVFHCHYPPCQYIVPSSQDREDRLFPPSLLKP